MNNSSIFTAESGRPMRVVFFASGGPANIETALALASTFPDKLNVDLVVTDRPGIPAIDIACRYRVPTIVGDFGAFSQGVKADPESIRYRKIRCDFHESLHEKIRAFEQLHDIQFDLAVLAYRLVIEGSLLARFANRAINQHPADLSLLDSSGKRCYVGIGGHRRQIENGHGYVRTSTILINETADAGEILVQGPPLQFQGARGDHEAIRQHEIAQKVVSDRPALRFALAAIASGCFSLADETRHADGSRVVLYSGEPLNYGGVQLNSHIQSEDESLRNILGANTVATEVR
ncbi:Phosphoribosylglycinamide formyltransferase [Paraburkholderia nemoris]|uniref:formyltransferase family protein n=1 Tax=Paraburkholderia nemoris TaxID=2793076 RepID=UPI00190E1031|nr:MULTISPECIES: formyltransferase family protein [Paraburkholderia]MBK3786669.1 methionyl-tRNA formyltransferase [Paraburkholderia aspalathi]CAE6859739.1 Phosphoribosylglycinamide formyltransferase [Paraburkholderia nemoris]